MYIIEKGSRNITFFLWSTRQLSDLVNEKFSQLLAFPSKQKQRNLSTKLQIGRVTVSAYVYSREA